MDQIELFAVWGAVTGTIGTFAGLLGLWLRFKQHGLDKPKLVCDASFEFDSPNHPKHKLTIRSLGRSLLLLMRLNILLHQETLYIVSLSFGNIKKDVGSRIKN